MDLFKALVFLSIAVLLATIGINADHIEQRKQKTEAVTTVAESPNNYRVKRQTRNPDEIGHIHDEHYGIGAHYIAMLSGDLNISTSYNVRDTEQRFTSAEVPLDIICHGGMWERGDKQKLCQSSYDSGRPFLRYQTSKDHEEFSYFQQASWMNDPGYDRFYEIIGNRIIKIKTPGIYIVQASVYFTAIDSIDPPKYHVTKNAKSDEDYTISKCIANGRPTLNPSIYPCQTWQLIRLEINDEISLAIDPYHWFEVDRDSLHLVVIKYNDYQY